ncbi:MAG: NAD(P)-dependent glycerol-3-phosphate dehydrogenase [Acidobacteriaceae bacterium]|nr:NAD(P)-dependent glycerol-3-phosphate dehydrogenase [Acidobacteriaceae bacterium]MBV9778884.1 NAD(P)-dependent glycerol-3-phosphate dehydrogenase [Acidobacteriaceae bacterium]
MSRLAVIGAGSWGTGLAITLAPRFDSISLWVHDSARAAEITRVRENSLYLPGFSLPDRVQVSNDLTTVVSDSDIALFVVPSRYLRNVLTQASPFISRQTLLVSATKGIEQETLCRMSQVMAEVVGRPPMSGIAVLSGPTFAREVVAGEPTAVVIASETAKTAEQIQRAFSTSKLRLYASTDVIGVELGAALKNVISIGAGICRGLGLGSNSVAALVTRGLAEITRLALAMGGNPRTLSGLAGLGDLVLTANGDLSRNRFVGIQLGHGHTLDQILASMSMVAEGVATCRAAHELGHREGVDLPIINKMFEVLYESKDPRRAISELMDRPLTTE